MDIDQSSDGSEDAVQLSIPGRSDYAGPIHAVAGPESGASGTPVQTVGNTTSIGTSGVFADQDVNGLLTGSAWDSSALTFSFPSSASYYGDSYSDGAPFHGFQPLSAAQQSVVRYALGLISQYTSLTFTEAAETDSTHATLRFAGSSSPPTSYAYYPSTNDTGGDVFYGNIRNAPPTKAGYAFDTILHEIGHAVGLKHGQQDDGVHGVLPTAHDSTSWSIMDYHSFIGGDDYYRNAQGSGNQTYMADDIAALQYMYGANFNTNAGDTTYTWSPTTGEMFIDGIGQGASSSNKIYEALWDGGGTDTYDLSNYTTGMTIDLRPGDWSTFSLAQLANIDPYDTPRPLPPGELANAYEYDNDPRSLIENAVGGSGNDAITGNDANNSLTGGAGNDVLDGGAGADTLDGGAGTDTASYASVIAGVSVSLAIAGAQDTQGAGTDTLLSIENLSGSGYSDILVGNSGANTLSGGDGDDTLDGGSGADTASYVGASAGVTVSLAVVGAQDTVGAGTDTLLNIENLTGSGLNDSLTGDANVNTLNGGAGNDALVGGDGNDTLIGGLGDDSLDGGIGTDTASYIGATSGVAVSLAIAGAQDTVGAGTDTLFSIESLTGSSFNDTLTGNSGANTLNGGLGDDTLDGGAANDTASYAGATSGVTVSLAIVGPQNTVGAGTDTLHNIEYLAGSSFDDRLTGNAGANILNGGLGSDTLTGGAGSDTFVFNTLTGSTSSAPDLITDFSPGDKIDLHTIDADLAASGDQAFHIGGGGGHAGDIVVIYDSVHNRTAVDLYADNNPSIDAVIWLTGNHATLAVPDFVL